MPKNKIALDIDEVVGDLQRHYFNYFKFEDKTPPTRWGDPRFADFSDRVDSDPTFWDTMPCLVKSWDLEFPVSAFISSRPPITKAATERWIRSVAFFPDHIPVYCIGSGLSKTKLDICVENGITHFVDDSLDMFELMKDSPVQCFLMDASHNKEFKTDMRLLKINDLIKYL